MSTIDEAALISLVQKYPLLYDVTSPLYLNQNHQKKEEAWNEISILMSASANECKTKWTRLRDNYRKALIVREKSGRVNGRAVRYENQLSFLNGKLFSSSLRDRNFLTLDPLPSNGPKVKVLAVESSPVLLKPVKASKKITKTEATGCSNVRPVHELNAFFESVAETVKTFPKKIQVQLKKEIFNLVNRTEASLVDNENAVITYYSTESAIPEYESKMNTDSPSTTGSTEYTESPSNPFQTTDATLAPGEYFGIQIKEEF